MRGATASRLLGRRGVRRAAFVGLALAGAVATGLVATRDTSGSDLTLADARQSIAAFDRSAGPADSRAAKLLFKVMPDLESADVRLVSRLPGQAADAGLDGTYVGTAATRNELCLIVISGTEVGRSCSSAEKFVAARGFAVLIRRDVHRLYEVVGVARSDVNELEIKVGATLRRVEPNSNGGFSVNITPGSTDTSESPRLVARADDQEVGALSLPAP
ncbi:MAG: hypothetical protein ACREXY_05105 [Gammaproteobacteria bacterium]